MGVEGIVSKRLGSRYRSGRSPDWLPPAARSQQARNPTSRQPGGYAGRGQGRVRGELEAVEGVGGFGKSPKSAAVGWLGCGVGQFPFLAPPRRGAFCFSGGLRIVFRCFACLNQSWWGSPSNFQPRFTAGFSLAHAGAVIRATHRRCRIARGFGQQPLPRAAWSSGVVTSHP